MYLRQMGKVPLLTREQEVDICKRIEAAEEEARHFMHGFGFAAKEYLALAEKLLAVPPKERFDRAIVDQFVASRARHLKLLRRLIQCVRALDRQADDKFAACAEGGEEKPADPAALPVQAVRSEAPGHLPALPLQAKGH